MNRARQVLCTLLILLPACQALQPSASERTAVQEDRTDNARGSQAHSEVLDSSDGGEAYKSLVSAHLLKSAPPDIGPPGEGRIERDDPSGRLVLRDRAGAELIAIDDHALRAAYGASVESIEILNNQQILISYSCSVSGSSAFTGWNVLIDSLTAKVLYVRPVM